MTQIVHFLNFFFLNSVFPCCTQSNRTFSELNFHQELLVELFVGGLLWDLVHENRILFKFDENESLYCSFDFFLTWTLQRLSQNRFCLTASSACPWLPRVRLSLLSFWNKKSPREIWETEVSHTVRTPNHPVLSCVVLWEVRDTVEVWIVDGRRVIICTEHIVGLFGLITCKVRRLGQVGQTPRHRCRSALAPRFWTDEMSDTAGHSGWPWGKREGADGDGWKQLRRKRDVKVYDMRKTNTHLFFCIQIEPMRVRTL